VSESTASDRQRIKIERNEYPHKYDRDNLIDGLAQHLEQKLVEAMNERCEIDFRMVEDLRLYSGIYDPEVLSKMKRSKVFIGLTRAKTDAVIGQLDDMLNPTSDKNWGIELTPVPELSELLSSEKAAVMNGQQYQFEESGETVTEADIARRELEILEKAREAMEKEINDQLTECRYQALSRTVISDACIVGTGVMKGPVVSKVVDKAFIKLEDGSYAMEHKERLVPTVEIVRPWDFYPDPSASCIDEAEYVFERRYMSKRQLRKLVGRKGFDEERINRVIELSPMQTQHKSSFQDDVRKLAGLNDALNDSRYETWEYHGPISKQVLFDLNVAQPSEDPEEAKKEALEEVEAIVFYCGGMVIGAREPLIDYTNDCAYKVFNYAENDASIFGYGLPRLAAEPQMIINTLFRQILDNGSITCGPQIGINQDLIQPMEAGNWELHPFKLWKFTNKNGADIRSAFSTFEFNSHLNELQGIYQMARVMFDEVAGIPMLQQGEQGQATPTLGGMSMLMNAANTVRRRQVRLWDDGITNPMISDFYHFNMLYSKKNDIKGDYQIDARGTTSLLLKETMAQALTNFLSVVGSNPVFSDVIRLKAVEVLRQWVKTQGLPSSILPTDDELKAYQKQIKEQQENQPQDPAIAVEQMRMQSQQAKFDFEKAMFEMKTQIDMQLQQANNQLKAQQIAADMQSAASKERVEMMKLAQNDKLNTEKLMVQLKETQAKLEQNWQRFMAELQVKQQWGDHKANYGLNA